MVERFGILGICMHAFMHLRFCLDRTQHKFYPRNGWKETKGHVCSSGEKCLKMSSASFFFFVCKLCSLLCKSQRLSSHCIQDDRNREIERGGGC